MPDPDFTTPDPIRDNELAIGEIEMVLQGIINPDTVHLACADIAERAKLADDPIRELRDSLIRVTLIALEIVKTMDAKSKRYIVKGIQEGQLAIAVQNIALEAERGDS